MPYSCQSVASLYEGLMQVMREHQAENLGVLARSAGAILALDNLQIARLLSGHTAAAEDAQIYMRYLGSSSSQILLPNVTQSPGHSKVRSEGITLCTIILVILSSIPMGASGVVSQLNAAAPLWGKIDGLHMPAWVVGLVQGALPQLMTSILMLAMRGLLGTLTRWQRCLTQAEAQMTMQHSYFWFLFTQLFVTTSLSSGLIPTMAKMLNRGLWELPRTLAQNLPLAGNYYLAYLPLQTALELATTIIRAQTLLRYCFQRPRWQPPRRRLKDIKSRQSGPTLGEAYPVATTTAVIVIIYALFSPLILPLAAFCATVSRVRFRYALTYVWKVSSPTNGELYLRSLFSLFWGLLVMELAFVGLFILKVDRQNLAHDITQITILALLLYGTLRYRKYVMTKYDAIAKGQEALAPECSTVQDTSTPGEPDLVLRAQDACNMPVDDGVIWIARDAEGVSDALVTFVRSRYLDLCGSHEAITNAHATLDAQGNVALTMPPTAMTMGGKKGQRKNVNLLSI